MSDLARQDKEAVNSPSVVTRASSTHSVHDPALEKRVWRKLDLYVLPVVVLIYLLCFLDRTNIGNARIAGLQEDLRMTDTQYSIALTMTYVPYIVGELPSNLLLRTVGPNLMLPAMLMLWGVVTTLQGLVKGYPGLLAADFIAKSTATQSLTEAVGGVVPGLVLYLSFFYPRHKMNVRMAVFFSLASLSGAFSGILAFGIIKIKESPTQARPGWAWVFILEGLFTVLFGIASFFLLPHSPKTTRFFTPDERDYVVRVLQEETATGDESFSWREVHQAFVLPQVVMLAVVFFFLGVILIGLALFTPSIIVGLGYTPSTAQLMSVPPFVVAFVVAIFFAFISDQYKCRGLVSITSSILCAIGFTMFLGIHALLFPLLFGLHLITEADSEKPSVQYCSLFFSISGGYAAIPALSTWSSNNTAPHTRRATAIAISFMCFNAGGILVTWLLGSLSAAPRYNSATIVLLVFSVAMGLFAAGNLAYLARQNHLKADVRRTSPRAEEKKGLGDQSAWFEYLL